METTSILLILTVLLLVAAYIGRPFYIKDARYSRKLNPADGAAKDKLDHVHSSLLAEKERILSSIQELDFDYSLHKVPEDLYPDQRANPRRKGPAPHRRTSNRRPSPLSRRRAPCPHTRDGSSPAVAF